MEYGAMVTALAKPGEDILSGLTPRKAHILHMAIGVAGEAGELLDAIKKYCIYGKRLDLDNVTEELGDLEFYMEGLRQGIDVPRRQILAQNQVKLLEGRYKSGSYSDEQAIKREDKHDD